PFLSPFDEFQRFKTHPAIRGFFEDGRRIAYGARAISEGGFQSLPKLTFPGGVLVGDTAGFLNNAKIKGIHTAMKSGMTAAEAVYDALAQEGTKEVTSYPEKIRSTWIWDELYRVRNVRPAFRWGLWGGLAYAAMDTFLFQGKAPWTMHNHDDHSQLKQTADCPKIDYPKPDGKLTFDKLSSLFLANVNHEENQLCHLTLKDAAVPVNVNLALYAGPEQRYCPAGVYEFVKNEDGSDRLQINAANCVHCKTCDIKDTTQNINWVVPEGGGGPNYPNM
ncbi:MAG: electron transfer flavoprotein-ubiquinone oxidoreductase, partial [Proteobacteria bacterium]|nr:electron transfer flavoprotein-ubiquinone oxidoreductase [Pseudomonadota bacterium]